MRQGFTPSCRKTSLVPWLRGILWGSNQGGCKVQKWCISFTAYFVTIPTCDNFQHFSPQWLAWSHKIHQDPPLYESKHLCNIVFSTRVSSEPKRKKIIQMSYPTRHWEVFLITIHLTYPYTSLCLITKHSVSFDILLLLFI